MDPGSCDFAKLVLSVASLLDFCNQSKELEHQDFVVVEEINRFPLPLSYMCLLVSDPTSRFGLQIA